MSIRIGFVGLRNIGRGHAQRLAAIDGVTIAAYCDTVQGRLTQCCEEVADAPCFSDYDEMLAKVEMDAMVISLPNHLHAPFGIKAMETGLHIYMEKPLAHNSEDAEKLIEARDRTGKLALLGMSKRLNNGMLSLKDFIDNNGLGKLYYGKAYWNRREVAQSILEARKDWGMTRENSGGGPVVDTGVHVLDQLLFLAGFPKPIGVSARAFYGIGERLAGEYGLNYAVEDFSSGLIHFENNFSMLLESSYFHSQPEAEEVGIELHGQNGCCYNGKIYRRSGEEYEEFEVPAGNHPANAEEHFYRLLAGKDTCLATLEEGLYQLKIIEAMYESADNNGAFIPIT